MPKQTDQDIDAFVRKLVVSAFWDTLYHEEALRADHDQFACAKAMLVRGNYTASEVDLDKLAKEMETWDEQDHSDRTATSFVYEVVGNAMSNIAYQERALQDAYDKFSLVKMLLMRADFHIDLVEVVAETRDRFNKRLPRD